jgi:hypothetical protein
MTIRSLSLNLALVLSDEIVPKWHFSRQPIKSDQFNVLVVPWPFEIPKGAMNRFYSEVFHQIVDAITWMNPITCAVGEEQHFFRRTARFSPSIFPGLLGEPSTSYLSSTAP